MPKRSAGLLLRRRREGRREVLLVHPGGPLWAKKDLGAWSIPKGELAPDEEPLAAARREVEEELGFRPEGEPRRLAPVRQPGGKVVEAWALDAGAGDWDPSALASNTFTMEWPPRSGRTAQFPEVDRAAWFGLEEARRRILRGQLPLLEELEDEAKEREQAGG
jgi:predicted NUDIX family NTP pyrophosphohydrolase